MRTKLTDRFVRTHKADGSEEIFDVGGVPGFGVRMGVKSASFFLVYRRGGKKHRHGIGPYHPQGNGETTYTLQQARAEAEKIRGGKLHPARAARRAREVGTFREVAGTFLMEMPRAKKRADEPELRPDTTLTYKRLMENALIPHFGDLPFNEVSLRDAEDFFEKMAKKTPVHANRCFSLMRRLYNWGIKKGYATENPCSGLELPGGEERPHEKDWTRDEIKAVLIALEDEGPITHALFWLAFFTACRRGELLKSEWGWIDNDKAILRVPARASKSTRKKEVVLTRPAVELLEALREQTGESVYLFPGRYPGQHLAGVALQTARVRKRSGVTFRFHDIRDAVANYVGDLPGATVDTVKHILGHITATGATKSYLRVRNLPDQRRALEKWADELERIVSGEERSSVVRFPAS